jgi:molybdopterin/thiamine biosynthesis adenylyltransferase
VKNKPLSNEPILFESNIAHKESTILYLPNGEAKVRTPQGDVVVPLSQQFDLTQATIFGLNERLTSSASSPLINKRGQTLRDLFNEEWQQYENALDEMSTTLQGYFDYGVYAYYPRRNDLVRFCPKFWHRTVATASTSMLIADLDGKRSWREIRNLLEGAVIGVAGASVGNNIAHLIAMDIRPNELKIADKSRYKMENINRVRLGYWDIVEDDEKRKDITENLSRNKSEVTAEQIWSIDPFMKIHSYSDGITDENVVRFFEGDGKNESPITILVEEVDDPRIKIQLRREARKRGIPLLMVSDLGSSIQLDIVRYDLDRTFSLTFGTEDAVLAVSMEKVYEHPGDRTKFFDFVDALIGTDYREGQLAKIIEQKTEIPTSTIIPQMGSTAMVAAGVMSEAIASILLNHPYPERIFFNKRTFDIHKYGRVL